MRVADLLLLALSALWQQKLRTVLTTLGVAFGALVLFVSLSIGQGVQDTIGREARKHDELRRIQVYSRTEGKAEEIPAEVLDIQGEMSPERRARLKSIVSRRWMPGVEYKRTTLITLQTLLDITELEHVVSVRPGFALNAKVQWGKQTEWVSALGVSAQENAFRKNLLVGRLPESPSERSVLISEYLAYRLGFRNDQDLDRLPGRTLPVEFRGVKEPRSNLHLHLSGQASGLSWGEIQHLQEKLRVALPQALAKLDLSPDERTLLETLTRPPKGESAERKEVVLNEELTIIGVFRMATEEESKRRPWDVVNLHTDLWLPPQTANSLFLRMPFGQDGFGNVTVLVDEESNVKRVLPKIEAMGFGCDAFVLFIEREQFLYKLIFAGMTCVAAVALLVAGLGITNTMLMSVLERMREVGVMKAVGASEHHIQFIFLLEGALIGLVGGGLGVLLSWLAAMPGDAWIRSMVSNEMQITLEESLFVFPTWLIGGVILFCGLVTTLAAFYPARRAGRINPVAALRHE
jgi:putative ABC transport system permease protein